MIRMHRHGLAIDVHPSELDNYAAAGWQPGEPADVEVDLDTARVIEFPPEYALGSAIAHASDELLIGLPGIGAKGLPRLRAHAQQLCADHPLLIDGQPETAGEASDADPA